MQRHWVCSGCEVFDVFRDAQQGPERINELFQKKTCEGVLLLGFISIAVGSG